MVGSAIMHRLQSQGNLQILTRNHAQLDLTDQHAVCQIFATEKVDHVFLAAFMVSGK